MTKRRCSLYPITLSVLFACTAENSLAQTETMIIPPEAATQLGDPDDGFADLFFQRREVEVLYGSEDFDDAPSDRLKLTEIAFRAHGAPGQKLDVILTNLFIQADVVDAKSRTNASWMSNPQPVLFARQTHLSGPAAATNAFDLRIPLDAPYYFDRRDGQLALSFHADGVRGVPMSVDAFFSIDGGYHYYEPVPPGKLVGRPEVPATKVIFEPVFAEINGFVLNQQGFIVTFTFFAKLASPVLESSVSPAGPFSKENSAEILINDKGTGRATLPGDVRENQGRFFRLKFERPRT